MIDGKSINQIPFKEYLIDILIKKGYTIGPISLNLLNNYGGKLKNLWGKVLEYLDLNISNGEIMKLNRYIKEKVNGEFSKIINQFVFEYEKSSN